jgi:hypothetical protein
VLVPFQNLRGKFDLSITFQGNIGAEAPCITRSGNSLTESVLVGGITMGPTRIRIPLTPVDQSGGVILSQAPHLEPILQVLKHPML